MLVDLEVEGTMQMDHLKVFCCWLCSGYVCLVSEAMYLGFKYGLQNLGSCEMK